MQEKDKERTKRTQKYCSQEVSDKIRKEKTQDKVGVWSGIENMGDINVVDNENNLRSACMWQRGFMGKNDAVM